MKLWWVSRRELIKGLAAVAGTAAGILAVPKLDRVAAAPTPGAVFIGGLVSKVEAESLVVRRPDGVAEKVIAGQARIWKGGLAGPGQVRPGDFVYVRGVRLADGSLAAVNIWVNIAQVLGRVPRVGKDTFTVVGESTGLARPLHEKTVVGPETLYFRSGMVRRGTMAAVTIGQPVHVLGLGERDGRTLRATRIWLAGAYGPRCAATACRRVRDV